MEIIVNAFFSKHNPEIMVGSFLGVGYLYNHNHTFNATIGKGQEISKTIDEFINHNAICQRSMCLLSPKAKKYGNTILRLYYDHLLAKNWTNYSEISYENFCIEIVSILKSHNSLFPYKPKRMANRIIKKNTILNIQTINGLFEYIQEMTRYNSYNATITESIGDLVKNYDSFNRDFEEVFPLIEQSLSNKIEKINFDLVS
ncbi:MAG TPA: ACP phosphodiesterase [Cytophagaceae bacterium]|jgi:acyl carrier protein phosphodiesterase|nr:ACP phosphodiesterase [Cytophagaceae bacterium]